MNSLRIFLCFSALLLHLDGLGLDLCVETSRCTPKGSLFMIMRLPLGCPSGPEGGQFIINLLESRLQVGTGLLRVIQSRIHINNTATPFCKAMVPTKPSQGGAYLVEGLAANTKRLEASNRRLQCPHLHRCRRLRTRSSLRLQVSTVFSSSSTLPLDA